ncbi:hypothetical protein ES695_10160 [Candidatus Atribacteria bacterium 1244-E10-H5-B2]|nr:MAG: hypothetical protein ES695_10160 [Candidatus Atribacteria bacterium 1244-E10-H5-B2]
MVRRVIFTGQPGIKTNKVCEDFISQASPFAKERPEPFILKIKNEMKNIYLKEQKKADSPIVWIREILMLPTPALCDLWEKAFKSVLKKIEDEENKSKDILITLHACFYLHYTVEYLSPVKTELLKRFQPDLFITLIDDIYDIYDRLRCRDQIFNPSYGGATKPVGAILELMRILDWRSKEIMMARHFANELNVPHYVFAVKHSYDTLYKLIFEDELKFYISHPISEVRRLQKRGEKRKANQMIRAIHRLENKSSSKFVCFLPTTIDELRIQKEKRDGQTIVYMPKLMPRWDSKKYQDPIDLLFIPPLKRKIDPLWGKKAESSREFHLLLEALSNHIEVQVSSRDHKLVEQSDFLFVYRPCFNGNISGGVLKEIQYYIKLTGSRSVKNCFIYMPTEDQNKLKSRQLEDILESKIDEGKEITCEVGESISLNSEEEKKLITAGNNINNLIEVFKEIMDNKSIIYVGARHGLESDKSQKAIDLITKTAREYIDNLYLYISTYKQAATVLWEDDNLSPETLVEKTIEYIRKSK